MWQCSLQQAAANVDDAKTSGPLRNRRMTLAGVPTINFQQIAYCHKWWDWRVARRDQAAEGAAAILSTGARLGSFPIIFPNKTMRRKERASSL